MDKARLSLALGGVLVGAAVFEIGFRLAEPRLGVDRARLERLRDFVWAGGETADYEPRPHVLYARPRGRPGINSLGFGDDEFAREKRPGVVRIACLGSSTTEGGNPLGAAGSYPHFLNEALARKARDVEVMNFGMSGWTTAEALVHYVLVVQDYAPDVVLVHEAVNDVDPRNWPGFRGDYSHYRRSWKDVHFSLPYRLLVRLSDAFAAHEMRKADAFGLQAVVVQPPQGPFAFADGRLPPETAEPFRRNVKTIAELVRVRGGVPVFVTMPYDAARAEALPVYKAGIDDHNRILRELAGESVGALVDLDALARQDATRLGSAFIDLVHLTPEGNRWKAERIAEALPALVPALE
jgi:lysophospholipase L1-like esterase